jgi:hypothetical protein
MVKYPNGNNCNNIFQLSARTRLSLIARTAIGEFFSMDRAVIVTNIFPQKRSVLARDYVLGDGHSFARRDESVARPTTNSGCSPPGIHVDQSSNPGFDSQPAEILIISPWEAFE